MTYEPYVISASEVDMNLTVGSSVFSIVTGVQLSLNVSQDVQEIFAIGDTSPIAIKTLNKRFSGNMSVQVGEYETLLNAINAKQPVGELIASLVDLRSFQIGWSYSMSGVAVPQTVIYSLDSCRVSTIDVAVDRNTPEVNTSFALQGVGLTRVVRNL